MPPGASLVTPPSGRAGRGLVIPVSFFFFTPPSGRGLAILLFFTPPSGRGLAILLFFFFFFFLSWSVAPDLRSVKTILAGKLCSFSVYSPEFS